MHSKMKVSKQRNKKSESALKTHIFSFFLRMLKLEKRGENEASQKERGFLPSPSPLSFFRPNTYP